MLEWLNYLIIHLWNIRNFAHLFFDHANRKGGAINWNKWTEVWQKMLTSTNVIKVSMRKEDRLNLVTVIVEPLTVWHHIVNTRIIAIRKKCTHINQNDFTLIFKGGHILTDTKLAKATNRNNTNGIFMWASPKRASVAA